MLFCLTESNLTRTVWIHISTVGNSVIFFACGRNPYGGLDLWFGRSFSFFICKTPSIEIFYKLIIIEDIEKTIKTIYFEKIRYDINIKVI